MMPMVATSKAGLSSTRPALPLSLRGDTTSPVTIENLPDRDFTSEQVANKLPKLLCFLM
jgi:hypothetical protein